MTDNDLRGLVRQTMTGDLMAAGLLLDRLEETRDSRREGLIRVLARLIYHDMSDKGTLTTSQIAGFQRSVWSYFAKDFRQLFWIELSDQSPLELLAKAEVDMNTRDCAEGLTKGKMPSGTTRSSGARLNVAEPLTVQGQTGTFGNPMEMPYTTSGHVTAPVGIITTAGADFALPPNANVTLPPNANVEYEEESRRRWITYQGLQKRLQEEGARVDDDS